MKSCPKCNKKFSKSGLLIHLGKVHHVRKDYDSESNVLASQSNLIASESKLCPVPGCGLAVDDLLSHAKESHQEWFLSSGEFVFEVV